MLLTMQLWLLQVVLLLALVVLWLLRARLQLVATLLPASVTIRGASRHGRCSSRGVTPQ